MKKAEISRLEELAKSLVLYSLSESSATCPFTASAMVDRMNWVEGIYGPFPDQIKELKEYYQKEGASFYQDGYVAHWIHKGMVKRLDISHEPLNSLHAFYIDPDVAKEDLHKASDFIRNYNQHAVKVIQDSSRS